MMMNDTMLDELLVRFKTERAPRPDVFTSVASFTSGVIALIGAEKREDAKKKPSAMRQLLDLYTKRRPAFSSIQMMADCAAPPPASAPALCGVSMSAKCCTRSAMLCEQLSMDLERIDDSAPPAFDTEEYKTVGERPFVEVGTNPRSTFGADVDTAMYANLRRMVLEEHRLPPAEAVRIEELLNYFHYDYPQPEGDTVLRPCFEMGASPWAPERRLLLIGVQAKIPVAEELPPSHYVFLIDNSGSMYGVFPMVKAAMTTLAKQLRPADKVSLVTYGGEVTVRLEGCSDVGKVCREIERLAAGGCTPGGEGIQAAYRLAEEHFIAGGNNRIVLITDGDFNVGASSEAELVEMVKAKRDTGVYLTVVGCGMGNYKDNKLKMLANKGNGNCFYIDREREAKRVFVHGLTGNMYALARDVKFQIEFNPEQVFAYRLIGYELRDMADRDFRDDRKESGTVGLGQQVTALYELIPADAPDAVKEAAIPGALPLKYVGTATNGSDELLTFRIRWKKPGGNAAAREDSTAVTPPLESTANWNWAAAVAEFGLALRNSEFAPEASFVHAATEVRKNLGEDPNGDRAEFLLLVRRAAKLNRDRNAE